MEVLIFQIGILLIIIICGFFGKSARNTATVLFLIFTVIMVFTSRLMIIQFITIGLAYLISNSISGDRKKLVPEYEKLSQINSNKTSLSEKIGCLLIILIAALAILSIVFEKLAN
jgi:hypothetical protein